MCASIASLERLIEVAVEEVDTAIASWEAARPTDRNRPLLERITNTHEANTFLTIRWCLHAHTAMALSRLWDRRTDSLGFARIDQLLASEGMRRAIMGRHAAAVIDRFNQARLASSGERLSAADPDLHRFLAKRLPHEQAEARCAAATMLDEWRRLFDSYARLRLADDLARLKDLRNKRLAHREVMEAGRLPAVMPITLRGVGRVLRASELLIQSLLQLVQRSDLSFSDGHKVQAHYATTFWNIVGESPRRRPRLRRRDL